MYSNGYEKYTEPDRYRMLMKAILNKWEIFGNE
jgi:hypothetical protein